MSKPIQKLCGKLLTKLFIEKRNDMGIYLILKWAIKPYLTAGAVLADKITPPSINHNHFLQSQQPQSFFLQSTNPVEVNSLISQFSDNRAM